MWWMILAVGAGFLLVPGMLNPTSVINGSTIIGLVLIAWATHKLGRKS